MLEIIHMYIRPIANKEKENLLVLADIQTCITSNFVLLVLSCQGKKIPSFLSMSYLISGSWDAFNIPIFILDIKRCYASVIISRKEIGRAKTNKK